jgi:hypothetical protein
MTSALKPYFFLEWVILILMIDSTLIITQAISFGDHNQVILVLRNKFLVEFSMQTVFITLYQKKDGMRDLIKMMKMAQFKMIQQ